MEDSIVIQSKISREVFDGFLTMFRLLSKVSLGSKEEINQLWDALKQSPCDISEIPDDAFDEDMNREQIQFMHFALAIKIGITRMEKGGNDDLA